MAADAGIAVMVPTVVQVMLLALAFADVAQSIFAATGDPARGRGFR